MVGSRPVATYELEFYEDQDGDKPVLRWVREDLTRAHRLALGQAMREMLQEKGVGVCATEYGKQLGKGLFEFRSGAPSRRPRRRESCYACSATHTATRSSFCSGATTRAPTRLRAGRTRRSQSPGAASPNGVAASLDP